METDKKSVHAKGKMSRTEFFITSLLNRLVAGLAMFFLVAEGYVGISIAVLIASTVLQFWFNLKRMRDASSKIAFNYIISFLAVTPTIIAIILQEATDALTAVSFVINIIILCLPPQKQKVVAVNN